ncbi:MAG: methyltransferase domain-containing protein [Candidatus Latescibacteria bacterium]|nr:methyltransferase domain-containing protein [Candidatus Latescibacterota bacterium]
MPFEFNGDTYRKFSTHQKEWGTKLIGEFVFRGDERILDLGCGVGVLTAQLAEHVPDGEVIGIDASHGMIETAQEYARDNVKYFVMDINNLSFDTTFDVVISNATLHWIKNHRVMFEKILHILNDDGIIRFNFAAEGNCSYFFKVIRKVMALDQYAPYFIGFEWPWYMPALDEYEALLDRLSFSETRVWGENADRFFPDCESLTGWIDQPSIVPFLKQIEQTDKQGFRDMVVRLMIEETHQNDGTYFETFRRINVFARK